MIERVAREIYAGAYPKFQFEHDAQHIRDHYREVARAVVKAMREPTPNMYAAGEGYNYPDNVWTAMIDEVLK
jgi:hypothetical protein